MNQQPDKLFRDKLEGHQRPAPASAWDRIESGLEKKSKPVWFWLKVAASVSLLAVSAWIVWPKATIPSALPTLAEHNINSPDPIRENKKDDSIKTKSTDVNGSNPSSEKKDDKKEQKIEKQKVEFHPRGETNFTAVNKSTTTTTEGSEKKSETQTEKIIETVNQVDPATSTVVAVNTPPSTEDGSIKIVVSANETEKYLKKKSPDEATSDEKKTSRFKKLLDKAEDLANNQDPLGEIRQKKNEILALNFKNEKGRGQNK